MGLHGSSLTLYPTPSCKESDFNHLAEPVQTQKLSQVEEKPLLCAVRVLTAQWMQTSGWGKEISTLYVYSETNSDEDGIERLENDVRNQSQRANVCMWGKEGRGIKD